MTDKDQEHCIQAFSIYSIFAVVCIAHMPEVIQVRKKIPMYLLGIDKLFMDINFALNIHILKIISSNPLPQ